MSRFLVCMLLIFVNQSSLASGSLIVVSGYLLKNEYSHISPPCPEGHICMDSWFVHTIRVKDTLAGETIRERKIKAIHLQHAEYIDRSKEIAIFILRPIDGQEEFGANYQIVDFSWPNVLYCFDKPLSELGLDSDDPITYLYKEACYESPFENE